MSNNKRQVTDLEVHSYPALTSRTLENIYRWKYLEMLREVQNLNRGMKRMRRKLDHRDKLLRQFRDV